jgi:hypothetical protein
MHLIKYNLWQVLISYMLRHKVFLLMESFRRKEYQQDMLIYVQIAIVGMIKILKF